VTAVSERPTPEMALGHPVRSFVLVLVTIGLALVLLQLSGLIQPRVGRFEGRAGGMAVDGRAQWTAVVIRNDGPLPVEVTSLHWRVEQATDVRVGVQPKGVDVPSGPPPPLSDDPVTPFTLDGGEARVVVLGGATPCPEFVTGPLRVGVRTPLGIERTVVIDGSSTYDHGPCE
jgi:hypothetical protein